MIYQELQQTIEKSFKSIKATIIVVTGAIAVGKTTALLEIKNFFEKQGIQVFQFKAISEKSSELLKLMYLAKQNTFALQIFILQEFQKNLLQLKILKLEGKINEKTIILFDRAVPDTIIFEMNNIQDIQQMEILKKIRKDL
ncbi:12624_t:CDS:1, partial [Cetraspora pellucida]